MKRKVGLSLYPDHSDEQMDLEYLTLGQKYGFTRVFMSMLEVTEGKDIVTQKFKKIISHAKKCGYEVILDIAPNIFEELEISYKDLSYFAELAADGIRLDLGFNGQVEAEMTYNRERLAIELNMSNDVDYLNNILTYQANRPYLYGCHNFYPQKGTGLPLEFFVTCSERFKRNGIKTAAFITSQVATIGPWDINDGLPTLEMHRTLPIEIQAKHLFATELIDEVIIGNAYASENELKSLSEIDKYLLSLKIQFDKEATDLEKQIVLDNMHVRRGDITNEVIRSTEMRKKYSEYQNPSHGTDFEFQVGDVIIGNDNFGKYKNELQIVLEPHSDLRKNKVGKIAADETFLLEYIHPWSKFTFNK